MHRRPPRTRLFAAALAATLTVVAAATATAGYAAAAGCRVAYAVGSQWSGGFTANVSVTNLGDPVNGWRLGWTFPSGQRVTQAWNATVTSSGDAVTAANTSYNAGIAHNASVTFGFNGSWTGANTAPTGFTLNDVACTGGVGTPSQTPSTPPSSSTPSSSPSTPPPAGNAMETVAAMQPGWNLGNSLDATG